jgi:uncharacterized membrane protein YkvA (DUF1232 family)
VLAELKKRAYQLKREAYALYLAYRDPRVPWYARLFIALVVAHTFSPIDLIPDFIPVLGYLDDLIITPLGISLALKMIPAPVMDEARLQADELLRQGKPVSRLGALLVVIVWVLGIAVMVWVIVKIGLFK